MTNVSTVYTATETKEALEATTWANPAIAPGAGYNARRILHLDLVIEGGGLSISPLEVYEALDEKFEVVAANKLPTRNNIELVVHKTTETGLSDTQGENPQSIQ
jgi:hypothetical protein